MKPAATTLLALAIAAAPLLSAQDDGLEVFELEPFVATGETYAFGAQKLVSVSDADIDLLQAADLEEIFSRNPSVQVGGALPAAQKLYVRGIEDKLLHITIDGATQAGYLSHHHGQYVIEPELLKQVQVEPGPGGAAVGPGALAGAVRFETKSAADLLRPGQTSGGFVKTSYNSNADAKKGTAALYGDFDGKLSAVAAYTYLDAGDYEDGSGATVDYTAREQSRAFVRLDARLGGRQSLSLTHESVQDEGVFRHRPNFAGYFAHPLAPNDPVAMRMRRGTTTLGYRAAGGEIYDLSARLFLTDNDIDRAGQYEMGYKSVGAEIRNASRFGGHALSYGIDYRDDTAYFEGKGSVTGFARTLVYQTIPDETVRILGAFVQDEWQLSESVQSTIGLRYDDYEYEDKDGMGFGGSALSPSVGISYSATDALDLNASYGFSYRGPTPIDLITANEGGTRNHPSLDGEWGENLELGFQYDNGQLFLNGTVYRQRIRDVITNVSYQGQQYRDNAGDMEVEGYDLTVGARFGDLAGSVSVSHSEPTLEGEPLVDVDFGLGTAYGRMWNASLDYQLPERRAALGWSVALAESYKEHPDPIFHKDSYVVHSLFARWQPDEAERWSLNVALSNVFDKAYVDQATAGYNSQLQRVAGLPAAGRDLRLSATFAY